MLLLAVVRVSRFEPFRADTQPVESIRVHYRCVCVCVCVCIYITLSRFQGNVSRLGAAARHAVIKE